VGFEPVDLGDIDDSQLQELGSALWGTTLEADEAEALAMRVRANGAAADPLTPPFEKLRDHAPDDPAFFFDHLSRAVFQAGHQSAATAALAGMAPLVDTGRQLGVVICGSGESRQDEHQRIARRAGQKRW
jgi:hypothetical protein